MSKFTQEGFLKRAKEKFGNRYNYSITKYEGSKKNKLFLLVISYKDDIIKMLKENLI